MGAHDGLLLAVGHGEVVEEPTVRLVLDGRDGLVLRDVDALAARGVLQRDGDLRATKQPSAATL